MNLSFFNSEIFLLGSPEEVLSQATGGNSKGIMVITRIGEGAAAQELDLLSKILNSVQLSLDDDVLLIKATPASRFSASALARATESQTVLLFGGHPEEFGLHFRTEKYQPFRIAGLRGVWADELPEISASKELKTALWNALKELFLEK